MPIRCPGPETSFASAVAAYAVLRGWRVRASRPARTQRGWRTPEQYHGVGFPDMTLCRERLVIAELKVPPNPLTPEQRQWQEWLRAAGAEVYVWTPADWSNIERVLA